MSHEFMDAQIFSPWCTMPRSLLAADLGVYIKKKKGVVVASESKLPRPFVAGGLVIGVIRRSRHKKSCT
jgi:hypothetical protein